MLRIVQAEIRKFFFQCFYIKKQVLHKGVFAVGWHNGRVSYISKVRSISPEISFVGSRQIV